MNILMTNVGERDLYYNVGTEKSPYYCHCEYDKDGVKRLASHLECKEGSRYIGEAILTLVGMDSDVLNRCRYPIIKTKLFESATNTVFDKVILVATNQKEDVQERFRDRDTIHTAHIIKLLIEADFPDNVHDVEIVEYSQPLHRDQTYAFFGNQLRQMVPNPDTLTKFHALLSGGIPSLNASLKDHAMHLFRDKCQFNEVSPPSDTALRRGEAVIGVLDNVQTDPFLKDLCKSIVFPLIERYDYAAVREVLNSFKGISFWDDKTDMLLAHATQRINLKLQDAAVAIKCIHDDPPYEQWYNEVSNSSLLDRIRELYSVADIRYESEEYPECLWRISSFYEASILYLFGILLDLKPTRLGFKVDELKKTHPDVHIYLSKNENCKQHKGHWDTSRWFIKEVISYCKRNKKKTCFEEWELVYEHLSSLNALSSLRNKMLHDQAGISVKDLNDNFRPEASLAPPKINKSDHHLYIIPTMRSIMRKFLNNKTFGGGKKGTYRAINIELTKLLN